MRGEFIGILSELKREIWEPLAQGNHPPAKPGAFGM